MDLFQFQNYCHFFGFNSKIIAFFLDSIPKLWELKTGIKRGRKTNLFLQNHINTLLSTNKCINKTLLSTNKCNYNTLLLIYEK
jgi:hypothetical protein